LGKLKVILARTSSDPGEEIGRNEAKFLRKMEHSVLEQEPEVGGEGGVKSSECRN